MKAQYINRHNAYLKIIHQQIRKGDKGNTCILSDGDKQLPTPVTRITIPPELLAKYPTVTKNIYPDLVVIETVSHQKQISKEKHHTIHIGELAVCDEKEMEQRAVDKIDHYSDLVTSLEQNGHNTTFIPIILGSLIPITPTECAIYMERFGMNKALIDNVYKKIWKAHLLHLNNITIQYRKLESEAERRNYVSTHTVKKPP
jgi:hypothetical protein